LVTEKLSIRIVVRLGFTQKFDESDRLMHRAHPVWRSLARDKASSPEPCPKMSAGMDVVADLGHAARRHVRLANGPSLCPGHFSGNQEYTPWAMM
jgi:hypothetical protein